MHDAGSPNKDPLITITPAHPDDVRILQERICVELDGAGRHKANALEAPQSMALLLLPPYSPELMPLERAWAWVRRHDLSNRVFVDVDEIDRACAASWNKLTPERIKTITHEDGLEHANDVGFVET